MKTILIILSLTLIGCASVNQRGETVTESGPFKTIEKHPDQEENIKEAPSFSDCEWVIPGTPSASGCEDK